MICPKITKCTTNNEANNSGGDRKQCICLFCDCDAAAHSEADQPGERREAGEARGDIKHNTFLEVIIHISWEQNFVFIFRGFLII